MGKIRTKILGLEEVEKKQKKEQKEKGIQKKAREAAGKKKTVKIEEKPHFVPTKVEDSVRGKAKKSEAKKVTKIKPRGKSYQKAKQTINKTKKYTLSEAVALLKKIKFTKFNESVELHLNVDKTGLKGELDLPHATGKTVRVKIVDDTVLEEIAKGKFNFDILITHPSYMPKLAKFAKILGPKGLMPNPKAGTISPKPEEIAKKFEKGLLHWKTEPKFPLIHQMIGKLSAEDKAIVENAEKFLLAVGKVHILSAYMKSTMSPSVKIDLEKI